MPLAQGIAFRDTGLRRRASDVVHVGLVNNMPDAALRTTELQIGRLLRDSAGNFDVRLHLFSIPSVKRSELVQSRMEGTYRSAEGLPASGVDAMIVTGAEPLAADLRDEPYWDDLVRLIDWARHGTISTLFSCLASHAAVLHLDGILRRPLQRKLSGVFDAEFDESDPLMAGIERPFRVPHARLNGLSASELEVCGYNIVSSLKDGDANVFSRKFPSLFVFLQCHPEYDADTLGREFVRDMGRYLRGENHWLPPAPQNYYDKMTETALAELSEQGRHLELLGRYVELADNARPAHAWREQARATFGNWLKIVAAAKVLARVRAFEG